MKKSILGALTVVILLCTVTAKAQCWTQPDCVQEVQVLGNLANENYTGSICFTGTGEIKNSVNVNKWDFLSYNGSLIVDGPLNMNKGTNTYANGSIQFDQVHFTDGDTLFITGAVIINKVVSNNSNPDSRNVIYLSENSTLIVDNHSYIGGDVITTPGNSKNEIDVKVCHSTALPVKLESFTIHNNIVSWKIGESANIESYTIQGSNDSKTWKDIKTLNKDTFSYNLNNNTLASSSGAWIFLIFIVSVIAICRTKKRKLLLLSTFILLAYISCSKNDKIQIPKTTNNYSYYRLSINFTNGTAFYSPIAANKN